MAILGIAEGAPALCRTKEANFRAPPADQIAFKYQNKPVRDKRNTIPEWQNALAPYPTASLRE